MNANTLHIELPSEQRPSLLPWIVILTCAAILLVLISQLASSIPASLLQQAQSRLDTARYPDVRIAVQGRDVELTGSISTDQSTTDLVRQLTGIEGVRLVRDRLSVVDPAQQAKLAAEQFAQGLANINIDSVAFQAGSVSFTPQSDSALSRLLALLQKHPEARVRIEGHTDNTGSDAVNLRVSRDRAAAVANYLMARGIVSDRLIVTGYGSTLPIADNDTEGGRARNRRIEISPVL